MPARERPVRSAKSCCDQPLAIRFSRTEFRWLESDIIITSYGHDHANTSMLQRSLRKITTNEEHTPDAKVNFVYGA
jgi:hypothetical protein